MNEVKIEMRNETVMFSKDFLNCDKSSTIHVDMDNLRSYLFGLINLGITGKYNSVVMHGVEEFEYLTKSMRVDRFCTRFYSYILKLNNELDGYLDYKYMLWADIFVNYMSIPDNVTILDFLKDYCMENEIMIEDLTGEGITNTNNSEVICV